MNNILTVITPTIGRPSLSNLIDSIVKQNVPVMHLILWDDVRDTHGITPMECSRPDEHYSVNHIEIKGNMVINKGLAAGSSLRSIGLMAAQTEFVTFADDDIIWEENHLATMLPAVQNSKWAFCKRKIWTKLPDDNFEYLGIDEFESVGEEAKTPYKMVDNNCMMFHRRFGVSAACLYRETCSYNDDRQFYQFLMKYAGSPIKTGLATINQVCPEKLVDFFRINCTK